MPVDGKTKAIFEVPNQPSLLTENRQQIVPRPKPPAVVTQHIDPPRKFIILTSQVMRVNDNICYYIQFFVSL